MMISFEEELETVFARLLSDWFGHHVGMARPLSRIVTDEFEKGVALLLHGIESNSHPK